MLTLGSGLSIDGQHLLVILGQNFFLFFWGGGLLTKGQLNHYCVWMGSRLDGGSRVVEACQGRVTAAAAPPPLLPSPFLEGSSQLPTNSKLRCRIKGRSTYFKEGPWGGSRYGCVGFVVFECVAAWECSTAQLRKSLTW